VYFCSQKVHSLELENNVHKTITLVVLDCCDLWSLTRMNKLRAFKSILPEKTCGRERDYEKNVEYYVTTDVVTCAAHLVALGWRNKEY
jgi:hypothetical protein